MRIKIVSKCFSNNSDPNISSQKENSTTSFESRNKVEDVNHTQILEQYNTNFQDLNPNVIYDEQSSSQYTQPTEEFNSDSSGRELKQSNSSLQNLNPFILNERGEQLSRNKNENGISFENNYNMTANLGAKLDIVNASASNRKKIRKIDPNNKKTFKVYNSDEELEQSNGLLRKFNADIRCQNQRKRSATPGTDIISCINPNLLFDQDNHNSQKQDYGSLGEIQMPKNNISSSIEINDPSPDPELETPNTKSGKQCISFHNQNQNQNFYLTGCKESEYGNLNQGLDQYYTRISNSLEAYELEKLTSPFITINREFLSRHLNSEGDFQQSLSINNGMEMMPVPKEEDEELKRAKAIVMNYIAEEECKFQINQNSYQP